MNRSFDHYLRQAYDICPTHRSKRGGTDIPDTRKQNLPTDVNLCERGKQDSRSLTSTAPILSLMGNDPRVPMTIKPMKVRPEAAKTIGRRPNLSLRYAAVKMTSSLMELTIMVVWKGSFCPALAKKSEGENTHISTISWTFVRRAKEDNAQLE